MVLGGSHGPGGWPLQEGHAVMGQGGSRCRGEFFPPSELKPSNLPAI